MKVCRNFPRYKGLKKPRCNKGDPCEACRKRYAFVQTRKNYYNAKGIDETNITKEKYVDAAFAYDKLLRELEHYG